MCRSLYIQSWLIALYKFNICKLQVSVLVMCHTRELAFQISKEYERFSKFLPNLKVSVLAVSMWARFTGTDFYSTTALRNEFGLLTWWGSDFKIDADRVWIPLNINVPVKQIPCYFFHIKTFGGNFLWVYVLILAARASRDWELSWQWTTTVYNILVLANWPWR